MKVGVAFPRKFAEAEDLGGKAITVVIDHVATDRVYRPAEREQQLIYVLFVKNANKGVVLSRRLADEIAAAVGSDEMDEWRGHTLVLHPKRVTAFGKEHLVFGARKADAAPTEPPPAGMQEKEEA